MKRAVKEGDHILVVSQYFWPENFRVNELVEALVERGYKVTVLTGMPNYPGGEIFEDFKTNPANYEKYANSKILRVPLRPRRKGKINLALNYFSFVFWGCTVGVWKLRNRKFNSIFVFETSPITVALPAILIKRIKKVPMTLWVLDLWPDMLKALRILDSNSLAYRLLGRLVSFIYANTDLILTQSKSFTYSIRNISSNKNIEYFPQWVEHGYTNLALTDAPELIDHTGKFVILFAGNIGECQDFPSIISAAELTKDDPNIVWIIVGDGRMTDWVQANIASRNLTKTVKLLGRFPSERMPEFFAAASVLLVSLGKEDVFSMTVPGKLQTYLMAGKPILGMLDGEGCDVIKSSKSGFCSPAGDYSDLAKNARVIENMSSKERAVMGASGRHYAKLYFERDTIINKMLMQLPTRDIS
jgi:colanic acid biosynthesis glycosyl transferase WcaI